MPNTRNYGLVFEKEMVLALNNKRYKNLQPNLQSMIKDMFGAVGQNTKIKCKQCEEYIKPDIEVTVDKKHRFVSLKTGTANVMHSEVISTLVPYMRECGVKNDALKTLCLFHYGDGTLDGTGKDRLNFRETYNWLHKEIKKFNDDVNMSRELVINILNRILFQGVRDDAPKVDYIYCGNLEYGVAVSQRQIVRHFSVKTYNYLENLHIGPLLLRPHAKYAHKEILNEYYHSKMDFYWPNISQDLYFIYKRYTNIDN